MFLSEPYFRVWESGIDWAWVLLNCTNGMIPSKEWFGYRSPCSETKKKF